jgi:uncharacterized protein
MMHFLARLSDLWIGRRAQQNVEALAAVRDLAPAVVVTGASRGIGLALARRFAGDESKRALVMIARDGAAIDAAAKAVSDELGVRTLPLSLDITQPDAPSRLDEALQDAGLYMDVLVNNAGVGLSGAFAAQDPQEIERVIALNITAATRMMHHALPPMLQRATGGILNVGSLGGFVPGPNQAAYYASKAYLASLTEAVAYEVRGRGVRISVVAPGPVDTTFHRDMRAENALYRVIVPAISADAVAGGAYRGFMLGLTVIVPGVLAPLAGLAVSILPHAITLPLVAALLSSTEKPSRNAP